MIKKIACALSALSLFTLVSQAQNDNLSKLKSGIQYKIEKDAPGQKYAVEGSMITMHIKVEVNGNSLYDSYSLNNNEPVPAQINKPQYNGDLMEGLMLLTPGDSAHFRILADSVFRGGMPPNVKSGDMADYYVKMVSVMTKEEFQKEQEQKAAKQITIDDKLLKDYIAKNKIKTQRTESGIYYVITQKGNGKHPVAADKVKVHYKGYKLNGETFDSSYDRGEPITFPLSGVIKGWTQGIPMFEEGGKGTLLIPSHLAYGEHAPPGGKIGPNEVLLFDVEIIAINPEEKK